MKTFTLRLTDGQAEILERISFYEEKSKNKIITDLIEDRYEVITETDPIYNADNFLEESYTYSHYFAEDLKCSEMTDPEDLRKAVIYDIKHAETEEEKQKIKEKFEPIWRELIEKYNK